MNGIILRIENFFQKYSHTTAFISFILGAIALVYTYIGYEQSIKEPEFEIFMVTDQGVHSSEYSEKPLIVQCHDYYDVRYEITVPNTWKIEIANVGQRTANNVAVKLSVDNISFEEDYIFDYNVEDHQRGLGGFQSLVYNNEEKNYLLPNQSMELPYLPFYGQAHLNNSYDLNNLTGEQMAKGEFELVEEFNLSVQVFSDDIIMVEKIYPIKIEYVFNELKYTYHGYEEFERILDELGFYSEDYPFEDIQTQNVQYLEDEDINFAYNFVLEKIGSVQKEKMSKFTIFFGREYYRRRGYGESAIENLIENDIWTVLG